MPDDIDTCDLEARAEHPDDQRTEQRHHRQAPGGILGEIGGRFAEGGYSPLWVTRPDRDEDFSAVPGPARMVAVLETKTVWHPVGT